METEPAEGEHFNDDISQISNHTNSSISTRRRKPCFKDAKPRPKLSERLKWNGRRSTFRVYKHAIESHITQVGMDYLTNKDFVSQYLVKGEDFFLEEDFYTTWRVSIPQVKYDIKALYGALVSSNRENYNRIIMKFESTKDGVKAWREFKNIYGNE